MQNPTASNSAPTARRYWDSRFAACALIASAVDLATKQLAVSFLGGREIEITERLGLLLVWNTGATGGYELPPVLWYLNVAMTAIAVLIMSAIAADLGRFHRLGAIALGIVTGGALGNLASMVAGPAGVADFVALHLSDRSIIFNLADVALCSGAALLIPVVFLLARAIRAEREQKSRQSAVAPA